MGVSEPSLSVENRWAQAAQHNQHFSDVWTITKKFNSFRGQTYVELQQALLSLAERQDCFITVLTGKGKFFSSGADITEEREAPKDKHDAWVKFRSRLEFATVAVTRAFIDHPKPLVVLLNGLCRIGTEMVKTSG